MKDVDNDPGLHGDARQETYFHRGQLAWRHQYGDSLEQNVEVTAGSLGFIASIGELEQDIRGPEVFGRSEWRWQASSWLRLVTGADISFQRLTASYYGRRSPPPRAIPNVMAPLATRTYKSIDTTADFTAPLATSSSSCGRPGLTLVPGVRADYYSDITSATVSPRLVARYRAGDATCKLGAGLFSQPPDYGAAVPGFGNPDLGPPTPAHFGLGIDQEMGLVTVGVEGFYKRLWDLYVNAPDGSGLINDGRGIIYGLEASAKLAPWHKLSASCPYTLSRSRRQRSPRGLALLRLRPDAHPDHGDGLEAGAWVGAERRLPPGERQPRDAGAERDLRRQPSTSTTRSMAP
jgi:hypothetical protein